MLKLKMIFLCLGIAISMSGQGLIDEAEAEDGQLVGVSIQTAYAGYSGSGYVGNFSGEGDMVSVVMSVPDSGMYKLVIWYGGFQGQKDQDILINDVPASKITFPATSAFDSLDAGSYYLQKGENTFSVKENWGYMYVDKFQLYPYEEIAFDIDKELIDLKADEKALALYEFLKLQFGERIISGQTSSSFDELSQLVGKSPMLKVGDLSSYTEGYPYLWSNGGHTFGAVDDGTVSELKNWHSSSGGKGLVSLQWHWHSPSGGEPGQNNFYTSNTDFDVRLAVQPGTEEYELIIRDIDAIAVQLKRFEDAGVPVLWRPLHEAGGGWFWWGAHGPEACLELWDIIYNRLTLYHKIHNLIWVWSTPEEDWYPGAAKVDIIGYDSYPGNYNYSSQKYWFDHLHKITEGRKLIAMTENGPIPDPDLCFSRKAPWLYFMSWSNLVMEQNESSHLQDVFNHESVLTLDSDNALWRSSLYPDTWYPGYKDQEGRFLHDFSYAGYHRGEDGIPFIDDHIVDVTQAPYFADNTGTDDVTTILQDALNDVGLAGGGVVYLPAGIYRIRESSSTAGANAALHMKYDSVILRGDGPDKTYIFHDQAELRQKDIIHIRKAWSNWDTNTGSMSSIRFDLTEPTREIPVESVSGFETGDLIVLRTNLTTAFAEEHLMDGIWDNSYLDGVMFLRKIDSIDAVNSILYIDVPTRYPLKTRDYARVYHVGAHISECGIEGISFGNRYNTKSGWGEEDYTVEGNGAYDVHYSHVIHFKYAMDCWVKQVHSYKAPVNVEDIHVLSNFLLMESSRNITVDSCDLQKSQYEGGGGNGYMYTFYGNECLVMNSRANDSRHNFDFKGLGTSGNVILNCRGENSKYSSDFHMYLSMSNLIDGFTVNSDYLECTFRPYGGDVLHGYPSTQSVFYNTFGEAYHGTKDYIVESKQFGDGYVIGTSGPADGVRTSPTTGTAGGFTFDTSPEDHVEGVGEGLYLRPVSLYRDQFSRRMSGYQPQIKYFDLTVEVINSFNGEPVVDARIVVHDTVKYSSESGQVSYYNMPVQLSMDISKEGFEPFDTRNILLYKDTILRVSLTPIKFDVQFRIIDILSKEPFWGVNVFVDDNNKVTDSEGFVNYLLPEGAYNYRVDKLSYYVDSGNFNVYSDSLFIIELSRSEAYIKFRLRREEVPVNNAWVSLENDSILSNNLGLALFSAMKVNTTYNYHIRKEAYKDITGSIFLLSDSTVNIEMEYDTIDDSGIPLKSEQIRIWPNPAHSYLKVDIPDRDLESVSVSITDLMGRIVFISKFDQHLFTIPIDELHEGIYGLTLFHGKEKYRNIFVKQ